ncbi:Tex family protein [Scopulibacillus cellulosilyticus]|uniref:Tex family protein n=1 Tax=Scopulibacillus cellulosilyticus TaxID=2665665 RepID=A0ABW2Q0K0_9BACL
MSQAVIEKETIYKQLAKSLDIQPQRVANVIKLLEEDNTIPFIARYRKELTGGLDEVQINDIHDGWQYALQLEKRKDEVLRLIDEQGKLTDDLQKAIKQSAKLQEVEDLYRPYKQKRRTRATIAKEKGLEPLADWLMSFPEASIEKEAEKYLSDEHELYQVEEVIAGAKDIIAERISDDPEIRKWIRIKTFKKGVLHSSLKDKKVLEKDEKKVYEMYYEYEENVQNIVPHRVLAINRGEKEEILKVNIIAPVEEIIEWMDKRIITHSKTFALEILKETIQDAYKRLIAPSIEREVRQSLTEKAEEQAIHIFSENLRSLLLQPPIKEKIVLGVDPAYRTGCKLAVVDETGKVLDISVIYPTPPKSEVEKAKDHVLALIKKFNIEMVAIGNGTASRETEKFIADVIKEVKDRNIYYLIVNEAGASVYSASKLAREEFPDLQVEERSAVSIARRLQDPLSELVKIDPKSVGVGQYQHDVSQKELNTSLTFVVETVVNRVGVNVNTASSSLLQYVAGLSKAVANNVIKKREEDGKYLSREQLKTVPRLGDKTFEQCAGFLRIPDGDEPLDKTAIHPESYQDAHKLLDLLECSTADIGTEKLIEKLKAINISETAKDLGMGEPTLKDIIDAFIRPSRDPRDDVKKPLLKTDVLELADLKEGMQLEGTVRNVVDFGAFVDVGVKQDGLVHISKLSNSYVKHPLDIVQVGQIVTVWVDSVDVQKGRISLTMLPDNKKS